MSNFNTSPFSTALPEAGIMLKGPVIQHQPTTKTREAKNRQWESLKPLIYRIYIEDEKPFPYLAKKLKEEHGFNVTKKQFSGKIDQWGSSFRKNVSRSERLAIMRNLNEMAGPKRRDTRLKAGRLKNWHKRYMKEVAGVSIALPVRVADDNILQEGIEAAEAQVDQAAEAVEEMTVEFPEQLLRASPPRQSESDGIISTSTEIYQVSWHFDWSKVDVPGSPRMSRLFEGLRVECDSPIQPISLNKDPDDISCLSSSQIRELFNEANREINEDLGLLLSSKSKTNLAIDRLTPPVFPYRDIENVFWGHSSSPLSEIYVFPSPPPRSSLRRLAASDKELRELQAELESRFRMLKTQLPANHPAVFTVMEGLSDVYYQRYKGGKAESMYRKLWDLYRQTLGPNNPIALTAWLRMIQAIIMQANYAEAQRLLDSLRYKIFEFFQPHDDLFINLKRTEAWLAEMLQEDDDTEKLRREILQICLASYGPRNWHTTQALSRLGRSIVKRQRLEGELLLRNALRLSLDDPTELNERQCAIMKSLALSLHQQGAYIESHEVATEAVRLFKHSLGAEHEYICHVECTLACSAYKLGRLEESENLFRALASFYVASAESSDNATFPHGGALSNLWAGLGNVLLEMGNVEEATGWFEKSFGLRLVNFGVTHAATKGLCDQIAYCYEFQGRYDDARKLYIRMFEQLRSLGNDPDGFLEELESEIARFEEEMACDSDSGIEGSSQCESEISDAEEEESVMSIHRTGANSRNDSRKRIEEGMRGNGVSEKEFWEMFIEDN